MPYGLIGAGPVSQYLVRWLPSLQHELGPVAASNPRLASRIVNTLRAGRPLRNFADLRSASVILVCAPGNTIDSLLPVLYGAPFEWQGKTLLLCDCNAFSRDVNRLRRNGASVASMRSVPGLGKSLVLEGDRKAVREARHFAGKLRVLAVEIDSDQVDLFAAALTVSSSLLTPILEVCTQAIQAAGVPGALRSSVLERLILHTLRCYLYSGKRSWSGTVAEENQPAIDRELKALEALHPTFADLYRRSAGAGVAVLKKPRSVPVARPRDPEKA